MKPVNFEESNIIFTKPESMTDEQCGSLPAWKGKDTDGFPCIISCWELSEEEKQRVQETGKVWLNIVSNEMPPVYVSGVEILEPK